MTNDIESIKKTPIFSQHKILNGKMVDFVGWKMPVKYEGIRQEHINTRSHAGIFDVSHMGELRIKGTSALETVEWLTTNCARGLDPGQAQYSLLLNNKGGVIDDIIVYCLEKNTDYLLCVNAANKDKDLKWLIEHNMGADIIDESFVWGQIALQGPKSFEILGDFFSDPKSKSTFSSISEANSFCFVCGKFRGEKILIARTGYTGEKGVEIFVPWNLTETLWKELLIAGSKNQLKPVGLGARDTLRIEKKFPLYGQELLDSKNPLSAGLSWVIKEGKKNFIGKDSILEYKAKKAEGLEEKKLVGFKMQGRAIPRQGYKLFSFADKPKKEQIGEVTSGTQSPSLGESIGMAYVRKEFSSVGSEFYVEIRGKMHNLIVVKTPFV